MLIEDVVPWYEFTGDFVPGVLGLLEILSCGTFTVLVFGTDTGDFVPGVLEYWRFCPVVPSSLWY